MNFRIRHILLFACLAMGLLPLGILTWLTYDRMITREISEVKDKHLLIAQNIAYTLSHYDNDVRTVFTMVGDNLKQGRRIPGSEKLLSDLRIENVSIIDKRSGKVLASSSLYDLKNLEAGLLEFLARNASGVKPSFTRVWKRAGRQNAVFLVSEFENSLLVGRLSTDYFQAIGRQVMFGTKGHAAIVDQEGNILSHPNEEWTKGMKSLNKVPPVQKMIEGHTGTAQFYSPALQTEMIAGYTTVEGPGWGVMIPQPVSELRAKALENLKPMFIGFTLAIIAIFYLLTKLIQWIAKPLENLNEDMLNQSRLGSPKAISPSRSSRNVTELIGVFDAYNNLALTTENNSVELAQKMYEDIVTGIGNRLYFNTVSERQIDLRVSQGRQGILIFLDLDGFKEVNDILGHGVGDRVLKEFARQLYPTTKRFMDEKFKGITGAYPVIGRLGGDEFAILLPLPDNIKDITETCEELRQSFPTSFDIDGREITFGVSAGGADYPDQGLAVDDLIRRADVALYSAKAEGRGHFKLYCKKSNLGSKTEILADVVKAIEHDELELHYQPKFCIKNQTVTGVEALVRWNHPVHGLVAPNLFLPAIQQTAVMNKLGNWVTSRAIKDIQQLEKNGHVLNVAINIGSEHFAAADFVSTLVSKCKSHKFEPKRLQVEVTENIMDSSKAVFKETVRKLQKNGFVVAIDDFGSGFSNLTRIASVPVDIIKLDCSLIRDAVSDSRVMVLMETAIKMAHALDSAVIVEGVETLKQVKMAEKAGANALQGFYFSKALPTGELTQWLEAWDKNEAQAQYQKLQSAIAS